MARIGATVGLTDLNLGSEGVGIPVQDGFHRCCPMALIFSVVQAGDAVAVRAVSSARKAFTVKLETSRVLAVAMPLVLPACGTLLVSRFPCSTATRSLAW